jgi:hypothetical protein
MVNLIVAVGATTDLGKYPNIFECDITEALLTAESKNISLATIFK